MGFLSLLVVALMPVLQLLLICFIGAILSSNRINVLPPSARKDLNKVKKKEQKPKTTGHRVFIVQVISLSWFGNIHLLQADCVLCVRSSTHIREPSENYHIPGDYFLVSLLASCPWLERIKNLSILSIFARWFMPVNIGFTFLVGGSLGWIAVKILKPEPHLEGLIIANCSAGKLISLN